MSDFLGAGLGVLFNCGWFILGPVVGYFIASKRGADKVIGAAFGLLGCLGWAIVFFLPVKKAELSGQVGRSLGVDETPRIDDK